MDLKEAFKLHWKKHFSHLLQSNSVVIVAASGGLDSTVLAYLFKLINVPFVLAHVNFQLRGEESSRDENFVRKLGEALNVHVFVKQVETTVFAEENKLSIQEAARLLRYNWFAELISANTAVPENSNYFLATAHHADDSVETVMMHFFRGTGIEGLKGIPSYNNANKIIRPLLPFFRNQLASFSSLHQIDFITDSSNLKNDYTRNFFRNLLIPEIEKIFPNVKENVFNTATRLSDAAILYKQSINTHLSKLMIFKEKEVHIPILKWMKCDPLQTITWEIIKSYGFTAAQTNEVIKLSTASNGSAVASASHRIFKNRAWLIIAPVSTEKTNLILIEKEGLIPFQQGTVELKIVDHAGDFNSSSNVEYINADHLQFPLILRQWKTGDYFYPLGMNKKKKLSKFFIDAKLSKTEKETAWLLEMNQKVLYIIGHRIDNRFKVVPATKKLLKITYLK
jgi:tRNA(Ile)-lysidine synthase